jgi:hypothetical protein
MKWKEIGEKRKKKKKKKHLGMKQHYRHEGELYFRTLQCNQNMVGSERMHGIDMHVNLGTS